MVRDDSVSSVPVDPLAGWSAFSLFPLSFNADRPFSTLDDPNPNFDLHSHLKAMVLRSPDKLLEQAKTILGDGMEPNKASIMASDGTAEKISSVNDINPQEKRPALGLKRAKFSAKTISSQPDVIPEPSIDIGKLKDPVEFFAAFERMENAKKELQRLRGQPLMNLDQNCSPLSPRRRRPSLYEKSATYKHHSYSSTRVCDNGEAFPSSREKFEEHIVSLACQDDLPETDILNNPQHFRVSDSTPAMTSDPNELDKLLSCDYGGLNEAGVLDLLQDKLQIKLRDFGKPALLDMLDVQRRESETSCDALPKMTDAIARLNGVRKAAGSRHLSLSSQLRDSSVHPWVSPVQPKSPLASMSLLNRHISKLSPSKDPFSALDIDSSPTGRPSKTECGKESDQFGIRKNLDESQTSLEHGEEITAVSNPPPVSEENITAQRSEPEEQLDGVRQSYQDGVRKDLHEQRPSAANGEDIAAGSSVLSPSFMAKDMSSNSEPKEGMDGATESAHAVTKTDLCDFRRSPVHEDQSVADFGEDPLVSAARGINPRSENKEQEDEVGAVRDSILQELNIEGSATQKPSANGVDEGIRSEALNTEDTDIQEPNEEAVGPSKKKLEERRSRVASKRNASKEIAKKGEKANTQSGVPVSEGMGIKKRKAEGPLQLSKREHLNRRNSLYGAGTKWEDGVRRSTRIKMRPLEYWRGERFLYGRVHDSMVTVIGVKYSSPSKEAEQPPVKVKSFVSDQYKELVDLAALH